MDKADARMVSHSSTPPSHISVLPSPPRRISVPPSPPRRVSVPPSPPRHVSVPPSPPRRVSVPPSPPRHVSVPPSPPHRVSVPPSPPRRVSVPPSPPRRVSVLPSPPRRLSVPPLPQHASVKIPLLTTHVNSSTMANLNKRMACDVTGETNRQSKRSRPLEATTSSKITQQKSRVGATSGPKPANRCIQRSAPASTSSGHLMLSLPHDAQDWMRLALKTMQSGDFGHAWSSLVVVWFKFEEKHGFNSKGPRLDATHRPRAIAGWIQHARKNYKPDSSLMSQFDVDFWRWWNYVQPSWRNVDSKSTPRTVEGSWAEITKHGTNGLYSVMGALHLWHSYGEKGSLNSWACAAGDVHWVLSQLLECA